MALITVDEVKTFLQISGTSKDDLIEALIPEIEDELRSACNRTFLDSDGNEAWEPGLKLPAADMIAFRMDKSRDLKSETQGGYSYTRQDIGASGYPVTIEKKIARYTFVSGKFAQKMQAFRDRRGIDLEALEEGKAIRGHEGVPIGSTVYPSRWLPE